MELVKGAAVVRVPELLNRRRTPRVMVDSAVVAQVFGSTARLTVVDISHAGMKAQTTMPFWPGARHVIRVADPHGPAIELMAQVVHCQRAVTDRGAPCFVIGCEFVPMAGADDSIARLVQLVAGDGPFGLVS
jgi:hypothetical protein